MNFLYIDKAAACIRLVDLHGGIDRAHEQEARVEADGARAEEERQRAQQHVAEVHDAAHGLGDVQLGEEIKRRVDEEVQRGRRGRQERTPPPMVVLLT